LTDGGLFPTGDGKEILLDQPNGRKGAGIRRAASARAVRSRGGFLRGEDSTSREECGKRTGKLQTGYLYHYAFVMLLGVAGLLTFALYAFR
jgi:hypothetical protein